MSEILENILDDCIEKVRLGKTIEETLLEYPKQAEELRPLLMLAEEMENLPCPSPNWKKMTQALATQAPGAAKPKPSALQWIRDFFIVPVFARALTVSLLLFVLGWGGINASSAAVPGEWLYSLKLLTERAQFFLTLNPEQKAELRIVFSSKRLKEAIKKYERDGDLDDKLLDSMLEEARLAIKESVALSTTDHQMIVEHAASVSEYQMQVLTKFQEKVPTHVQQKITQWMNMCDERRQWMRGVIEQSPEANFNRSDSVLPDESLRNQREESLGERLDRCMENCPTW